jgi:two-component system CheB/CheR fusion protein
VTGPDPAFESLLIYLRDARGFDFTGYKRSSLMRRVDRRMSQVGLTTYAEYLDHLEVHPDEFTPLFNMILINVTSFFRDPDAWAYLREKTLPDLIASRPDDAPIRVWSAGCASGEEAYTAAMVLADLLGPDQFKARVKIYATDVDEEGLTASRQATYSARSIASIPDGVAEGYFEPVASHYTFRKDLRRSVIVGRNNLVQDAPISRVDLLICRNTLMYLNAETQSRILTRFHFALAEHGVLFLGKAEMLLSHTQLFEPIDLSRRLFGKIARASVRNGGSLTELAPPSERVTFQGLDQLRSEVFVGGPVAQLVLTPGGSVVMINRKAELLFGLSSLDIGRPFRDLDVSYRPIELRRSIELTLGERRTVRVSNVEFYRTASEKAYLEIEIHPVLDSDGRALGVTLCFHDVTEARRLQDELEVANRQLEAAYEELQSTNEELETTNEELQSTVEELETTNEELQSTNEELETMNEETQSTNEELQNINDQLRESSEKLDGTNRFLEAILRSLRSGVAVVNRDLLVEVWNRQAENLWGINRDEAVGQHFLNLDIGLPTAQLRPLMRQALFDGADQVQMDLPAVNRRGRTIILRVVVSPLTGPHGEVTGAVLVMDDDSTVSDGAQSPRPAPA